MGLYLSSIVEVEDAEVNFMNAHNCYMQWGAIAKAKKLWDEHNLGMSMADAEISTIKHKIVDGE